MVDNFVRCISYVYEFIGQRIFLEHGTAETVTAFAVNRGLDPPLFVQAVLEICGRLS